ncbi:hypothetical protein HK100_007047 [Physocladia obscura]|uniref:N-acetyltransferase domain-containing protein n=1 Tax=Physocladia obscura TaxID=109957 RepID=A0AAD5T9N0_9FUNG|nr:hypothetical protein HK100_007047 [Physocladia obscura]
MKGIASNYQNKVKIGMKEMKEIIFGESDVITFVNAQKITQNKKTRDSTDTKRNIIKYFTLKEFWQISKKVLTVEILKLSHLNPNYSKMCAESAEFPVNQWSISNYRKKLAYNYAQAFLAVLGAGHQKRLEMNRKSVPRRIFPVLRTHQAEKVMSSAYGSLEAPLAVDRNELARVLPVHAILKDGTRVVLEQASATLLSDEAVVSRLNAMLNYEIDQGNTYPQEFTLDRDSFKAYFLSAAAFVLRAVDNANEIIGTFYVKPNYPGRCSHICNGGFITANEWRGKGVGKILANTFLTVAPLLGYKASVFNLVFA